MYELGYNYIFIEFVNIIDYINYRMIGMYYIHE